ATGNNAAIMMKPTPRMITANITSAKENPCCRTLLRISFTFHQGAVVAVDQDRRGVVVEPGLFGQFRVASGDRLIVDEVLVGVECRSAVLVFGGVAVEQDESKIRQRRRPAGCGDNGYVRCGVSGRSSDLVRENHLSQRVGSSGFVG